MKTKIIFLAALPLALVVTGCEEKQSEDTKLPATNNPAAEQPAAGATAAKSVMPAPNVTMADTNKLAVTNWPSTNKPTTASP